MTIVNWLFSFLLATMLLMIKSFLALLIGKLISFLTKFLKAGGGSAAPGLYALKADPLLIQRLASQIPTNIIVTGTNGKTTTARLLHHFLTKQGIKTIRNGTGSNLERGIASALLAKASFWGQIKNIDVGIWEVDEAAFNTLASKLKPDVIVFLNAFRDQLDRYGEVDSVVRKWQNTLDGLNKTCVLLINGDDTGTAGLTSPDACKVEYFGIKGEKIVGEKATKKTEHSLTMQAEDISLNGIAGSSFKLKTPEMSLPVKLPLPGLYQVYNFLAAASVYRSLNMPQDKKIFDLIDFKNAFGRVEEINYKGQTGYILLIKNPVGATSVFETIREEINSKDVLLMALNDNFADGTDVSWIWDAEFERFKNQDTGFKIICSGSRAYDLALRVKYAGFEEDRIIVEQNIDKAFEESFKAAQGKVYILPTYTALLELQKLLEHKKIKKHYWKEN